MGIKFNTEIDDSTHPGKEYSPGMTHSESSRNQAPGIQNNAQNNSFGRGNAPGNSYAQNDLQNYSYGQENTQRNPHWQNHMQNSSLSQDNTRNIYYDHGNAQRNTYSQNYAKNSFHGQGNAKNFPNDQPYATAPGSSGEPGKRRKIFLPIIIACASILVLIGIFFIAKNFIFGSDPIVKESRGGSGGEGSVLNIAVWNEEFMSRMADHYPGYEKIDETTGKIGDVTVKWHITPNQDNAYQSTLDGALAGQAAAAADDKIDIFLIEADYALKYVDADANVAMPLTDLGITDVDLSKQFAYTRDVVRDANGVIRGSSWQACSGGMIYRRDVAQEVFGVSDPADVQELFRDWDAFRTAAAKLKEKGYHVTSSVYDTYRVYSNNVSGQWVQDGKIVVDDNIRKWADNSKELIRAGETDIIDIWSDDWAKGFFQDPDGRVFAYFGPLWFINFSMREYDDGSVAKSGGWALTTGPQSFYWGGTWICAAQGTDNPALVKDIILTMTTDDAVMKDITVRDSDCANNKDVLKELAEDASFGNAVLGGQNPYGVLAASAEHVDKINIAIYDQGCNEEYQRAMKKYLAGSSTYADALAEFEQYVKTRYPELS